MTRHIVLLTLVFLLAGVCFGDGSQPCDRSVSFHVASPTTGWLMCNGGLRGIEGEAILFDITDRDDPTAAAKPINSTVTIGLRPVSGSSLFFARVDFRVPLQGGRKYILRVAPGEYDKVSAKGVTRVVEDTTNPTSVTAPTGWAPLFVSFSTAASALIINTSEPLDLGASFLVASDVALRPCSDGQSPKIVEMPEEIEHPAVLQRQSLNDPTQSDSPTPNCELPVPDSTTNKPQFNPDFMGSGEVRISEGRLLQNKVQLTISGVTDIFGQELKVPKEKQKLTLRDVPKGKDDAMYYLKFAHQAGPGAKPAWSLDAKAAPIFAARFATFYPTLNLLADVGFGDTKSANTIKLGGGLTRLFRLSDSTLQAVRFSPTLSLEANRDFDTKRNLIFEPDVRFYLPFLNYSRDLQSQRAYLEDIKNMSAEVAAKVDRSDPKYKILAGFSGQFWVGLETGASLVSPTVKTKDGSSSVVVPGYSILRLRPHAQFTVEWWRFSFDVSGAPRYIAVTENVGRIVPVVDPVTGKKVDKAFLYHVTGWRGYGELTFQYEIDPSRHISFSSTYKRGSAPPTFDKVDTVQTGLSIKY